MINKMVHHFDPPYRDSFGIMVMSLVTLTLLLDFADAHVLLLIEWMMIGLRINQGP